MKKKLNLKDLKVKSFVTLENAANIKGASGVCVNLSDQLWSLCQTCGIYC